MNKQIKEKMNCIVTVITFREFTLSLIKDLTLSGRYGTAHAYSCAMNRLLGFASNPDLSFESFTPEFLKRYEQYLLSEGRKRNTVSLYMRMLRAICNQAVRLHIANLPAGLFSEVFTGTDTSRKRALTPACISQLREADLSQYPHLEAVRDIFLLSFYLRGIPFVDLIRLRKVDIDNGVLRYRRSKTGCLLTIRVEPCARVILKKYTSGTSDSSYLFPVIKDSGFLGYRQYQKALRGYNTLLGELSLLLGLKVKLTSYVARHSWATAAYHQGIPVSVISESLGHASEKITYTYLASFDNHTLNKANRKVIGLVSRSYPYGKSVTSLLQKCGVLAAT
ncbi:site-specific integrase [Bacteroidaceae bacterium HV4-6-C5C]|nr:site-specific integrase [Bacteroidaceae bacterium HV4-6-C5C]